MLRAPSRSPLAQLIARIVVVALVAAAVPMDATASLPAGDASSLTRSALGELLAHTGTDPQPYAFTGEPYDPNVGFQYHRARWMDPRVGRFVGKETDEFRRFKELDDDVLHPAFAGLVISDEIWDRIGRPAMFERFRPGYVWRPYVGETSDL